MRARLVLASASTKQSIPHSKGKKKLDEWNKNMIRGDVLWWYANKEMVKEGQKRRKWVSEVLDNF